MKRFCTHLVLILIIGLCLSFPAYGGRTIPGYGQGIECECGQPAPPACYDEQSGDPCTVNGRTAQAPPKPDSQNDLTSLGLVLLTALYLIRRVL